MIGADSLSSDMYGGIPENDLMEWGHDALGRIHTATQKVHKIAVITIKDHRGILPRGFLAVIQAAYRQDPEVCCTREQVVQWTQDILDGSGCKIVIDLECPSCHHANKDCTCDVPVVEVDANRIYRDAHPEQYYGYLKHFYAYGNTFARGTGCAYTNEFQLMRRTSNEFYNIPYHIGDCVNFKVDSPIEYEIHPVGDTMQISTTFRDGEVLLSYMSEKTDSNGYRMVPNTSAAIAAVLAAIDERVSYRMWRSTRDAQDGTIWRTLMQERERLIGRAVAELKIPDQDKWINFLETNWKQTIPFWSYDRSRNLRSPGKEDLGNYWAGVRPYYNPGT